jgi:PHP family Zn ribbon phosphoesterase
MNYQDVKVTKGKTVSELIDEMAIVEEKLESLGKVHLFLYRAIIEGMEEMKATLAKSEKYAAELTPKISYDSSVLAKLREITDPSDLDGVYTPEHEEVKKVPEKWNMVKGKKLLKLGNDHQAIIDDAKIFGNPSLKIYKKGDGNG